jgi:hypothetical protein
MVFPAPEEFGATWRYSDNPGDADIVTNADAQQEFLLAHRIHREDASSGRRIGRPIGVLRGQNASSFMWIWRAGLRTYREDPIN